MKTYNKEIICHAIDGMSRISEGQECSDLHHVLFNEDYFIIGYARAEEFLTEGPGIFAAIEKIRQYEMSNFGQVTTDFSSSEKVANMYAYIEGEELLNDCQVIEDAWNEKLSQEQIDGIKGYLEFELSQAN